LKERLQAVRRRALLPPDVLLWARFLELQPAAAARRVWGPPVQRQDVQP
jgi:hypothetical protein